MLQSIVCQLVRICCRTYAAHARQWVTKDQASKHHLSLLLLHLMRFQNTFLVA